LIKNGEITVLCVPHPYRLKAGKVEPKEMDVTKQRLGKHVPAATNTHTTIEELLYAVRASSNLPLFYDMQLVRRRNP
jgi:hypothetical protein